MIIEDKILYRVCAGFAVSAYDREDKDTAEFFGNLSCRYAGRQEWVDIYPTNNNNKEEK